MIAEFGLLGGESVALKIYLVYTLLCVYFVYALCRTMAYKVYDLPR